MMQKWRWLARGLSLALLGSLSGCAPQHPHPAPKRPALTIQLSPSDALLDIPVYLAQGLHQFSAFHLSPRLIAAAGKIAIAPAGQAWPIYGQIAVGPELVLVHRGPDPHFRLSQLAQHPLSFASHTAGGLAAMHQALDTQHISPAAYIPLSLPEISCEWRQHALSTVVLSFQQWTTVRRRLPHAQIIHWFGADLGPVPAIIVSAPAPLPQMSAFLAACNVSLQVLHTASPQRIAQILAPVMHQPIPVLTRWVRFG
ncbi:MAG: hypothetical protein OWS74_02175, partial [Firmicutes bacterium]|nr:hypothetical protein [Bacillota bacterium]